MASGTGGLIARHRYRGHLADGGGEVEIATLALTLIEGERTKYFEVFDDGDAEAAFGRFEEIGAATEPERLRARIIPS